MGHWRGTPNHGQHLPALVLLALVAVPVLGAAGLGLGAGLDRSAWEALVADPQTPAALASSLWTGLVSTGLALALCAALLASRPLQTPRGPGLGAMLALPHAAFAIGLVALIAPSGWLARLVSPWLSGWDVPPAWRSTQDPWGLGLITVLVCKETPFLLWAASAYLQQPAVAQRLQRELQIAATLGHGHRRSWWQLVWPPLLAQLTLPLLAVLAYGLTVVDVALVIGPTAPPPLSVLAWQWLSDASTTTNAKGAAAGLLLALVLLLCSTVTLALQGLPFWRWSLRCGPAPDHPRHGCLGRWLQNAPPVVYGLVLVALALGSVSGYWPFPHLLPGRWTLSAWNTVLASSPTLWTTLALALGSAAVALLWSVAWLECAPARWYPGAQALLFLPLVLPATLWVLGLHRLGLYAALEYRTSTVWLAHSLACLPYVLLTLQGSYRRFDPRMQTLSSTLGRGRWAFLLQVKWPLLRAPLGASFAVGFAVSVAQYLPTLYLGGGRLSTVTTEAVTLASGGARALSAAFAGLQWLLPALVFAAAAALGRTRRFPPPPATPPAQAQSSL